MPFVNVDVAEPCTLSMEAMLSPPLNDDVAVPCTTRYPVVVAPPLIVSPPAWVPAPIVEDADEMRPPVKVRSDVVAFPGNGSAAPTPVESVPQLKTPN